MKWPGPGSSTCYVGMLRVTAVRLPALSTVAVIRVTETFPPLMRIVPVPEPSRTPADAARIGERACLALTPDSTVIASSPAD